MNVDLELPAEEFLESLPLVGTDLPAGATAVYIEPWLVLEAWAKCPNCPNVKSKRMLVQVYSDGSSHHWHRACGYAMPWSPVQAHQVIQAVEPDYDVDRYREEIKTAMNHFAFRNYEDRLECLRLIEFEIWKSSKVYGDTMNERLAHDVAKNTTSTFVKGLIRHPGGITHTSETDRVFAEPVTAFNEEEKEEYVRPAVEDVYTANQEEMHREDSEVRRLERKHQALLTLKSRWFGSKLKVAEALLAGTSMADVTGVPKTTAERIRAAIRAEVDAEVQRLQ